MNTPLDSSWKKCLCATPLATIHRAKRSRRLRSAAGAFLAVGLVLAAHIGSASATCDDFGGFAIFQCADLAYFNPPPDFSAEKYFADPNNPAVGLQNVTAVFWQIGFGNNTLNTALGTFGTGNSGPSTFSGNDSGLLAVALADTRTETEDPNIPVGAFCLQSSNNWGAFGVDGCCDNDRGTTLPMNDDGILNPYYDVYYARNEYPGIYSLNWQQDYPMAVLLTESSGRYFAFAAVATMNRGNTGDAENGPCAAEPGENPAPCDPRMGFYPFKAVSNGLQNPAVPDANNVIPWQETPQPEVTSNTAADPNDPNSDRVLDMEWPAVTVYSDGSLRPTTHPQMGGLNGDPNQFAGGVGVNDIGAKFPLVRHLLEVAAEEDPNFASPLGFFETTSTSLSGINVPPGSCLRLRTLFGKKPQTGATSTSNCRVGKCGDIGYEVLSERFCLGGDSGEPGDGGGGSGDTPPSGDGEPLIDSDVAEAVASKGWAIVHIVLSGARPLPEAATSEEKDAFLANVAAAQVAFREQLPEEGVYVLREHRYAFGLIGWVDEAGLEALASIPDVARVYLDTPFYPLLGEGVPLVGGDVVQTCGNGGGDVVIGIADFGIDYRHLGLGGCFGSACKVVGGMNCVGTTCPDPPDQICVNLNCNCDFPADCLANEACVANGCCRLPVCVEADPNTAASVLDHYGHGTQVAAVAAGKAASQPGQNYPLNGVAPDAALWAVKIIDIDPNGATLGGSFANLDAALDWLLDANNRFRSGVKVLNLSIGDNFEHAGSSDPACDPNQDNTAQLITSLWNAGVPVTVASGNNGFDAGVNKPACVPAAIAVGGVYDANVGSKTWAACTDSTTAPDKVRLPHQLRRTAGFAGTGLEDHHGQPDQREPTRQDDRCRGDFFRGSLCGRGLRAHVPRRLFPAREHPRGKTQDYGLTRNQSGQRSVVSESQRPAGGAIRFRSRRLPKHFRHLPHESGRQLSELLQPWTRGR